MNMTAAAVGVTHTFEVLTQTERAAVVSLWHSWACCIRRLLHRLPKSESRSDLEVGGVVRYFVPPLVMWWYSLPLLSALTSRSWGAGLRSGGSDGGW